MLKRRFSVHPGWIVVIGVAVILFGTAGSRFSFGVFLKPLTDDFGWSRGSLSGALAIAGLSTGLLRPLAGWTADRFDPVRVALTGVALGGIALVGLSRVQTLWQLYVLFIVMGIGFTLASPATLTKLVSARFTRRRSLALSLAGSGSAVGETALVPLSAVILVLSGWRSAYMVLAAILILGIIPIAFMLLRARPGVEEGEAPVEENKSKTSACAWAPDDGMSLREAVKTPIFWALTAGFFT
jgi:MFS family permease